MVSESLKDSSHTKKRHLNKRKAEISKIFTSSKKFCQTTVPQSKRNTRDHKIQKNSDLHIFPKYRTQREKGTLSNNAAILESPRITKKHLLSLTAFLRSVCWFGF